MRALLVVAVMAMGCGPARLSGAPVPGEACAEDGRTCMTAETIGLCAGRRWHEWPCVGACTNATSSRCELEMPKHEGEACPPGSIEGGAAACVLVDGGPSNQVLKCVAGVARASACTRCRRDDFLNALVCD